jgi:adenosylcobinamide-phosphate synthase
MTAAYLACALALDAALGEPKALWDRWPHPAVLMGRAVDALDRRLNAGANRRARGVAAVAALVAGAWALGSVVAALPFGGLLEIAGAAVLLAHKSLVEHVAAVAAALPRGLDAARAEVGKIVGRDTDALDGHGVARAAIESGAESFCDGVVAPAFWFLLLGLPGLLVHKVVNTADSMIGHRTPRHEAFGWAAARLDDALNFVPARLSAALIAAASLSYAAFETAQADAPLHPSPNAGWPQAAMARALGLALHGPRRYDGETDEAGWFNDDGRAEATAADIDRAVALLWRAWGALLALAVLLAAL